MAQAYTALLAAFAPLGPGAPFAALAVTGPVAIAQAAAIAAQKPPQFHDGGILDPDESMFGGIKVRANEAAVVFNERAVQQGAVEDAMTRNRGAESRQQVAVVNNAGRAVARLFLDELGDPASDLSRAIPDQGGNFPRRVRCAKDPRSAQPAKRAPCLQAVQ